jgi:hypothetical protein
MENNRMLLMEGLAKLANQQAPQRNPSAPRQFKQQFTAMDDVGWTPKVDPKLTGQPKGKWQRAWTILKDITPGTTKSKRLQGYNHMPKIIQRAPVPGAGATPEQIDLYNRQHAKLTQAQQAEWRDKQDGGNLFRYAPQDQVQVDLWHHINNFARTQSLENVDSYADYITQRRDRLMAHRRWTPSNESDYRLTMQGLGKDVDQAGNVVGAAEGSYAYANQRRQAISDIKRGVLAQSASKVMKPFTYIPLVRHIPGVKDVVNAIGYHGDQQQAKLDYLVRDPRFGYGYDPNAGGVGVTGAQVAGGQRALTGLWSMLPHAWLAGRDPGAVLSGRPRAMLSPLLDVVQGATEYYTGDAHAGANDAIKAARNSRIGQMAEAMAGASAYQNYYGKIYGTKFVGGAADPVGAGIRKGLSRAPKMGWAERVPYWATGPFSDATYNVSGKIMGAVAARKSQDSRTGNLDVPDVAKAFMVDSSRGPTATAINRVPVSEDIIETARSLQEMYLNQQRAQGNENAGQELSQGKPDAFGAPLPDWKFLEKASRIYTERRFGELKVKFDNIMKEYSANPAQMSAKLADAAVENLTNASWKGTLAPLELIFGNTHISGKDMMRVNNALAMDILLEAKIPKMDMLTKDLDSMAKKLYGNDPQYYPARRRANELISANIYRALAVPGAAGGGGGLPAELKPFLDRIALKDLGEIIAPHVEGKSLPDLLTLKDRLTGGAGGAIAQALPQHKMDFIVTSTLSEVIGNTSPEQLAASMPALLDTMKDIGSGTKISGRALEIIAGDFGDRLDSDKGYLRQVVDSLSEDDIVQLVSLGGVPGDPSYKPISDAVAGHIDKDLVASVLKRFPDDKVWAFLASKSAMLDKAAPTDPNAAKIRNAVVDAAKGWCFDRLKQNPYEVAPKLFRLTSLGRTELGEAISDSPATFWATAVLALVGGGMVLGALFDDDDEDEDEEDDGKDYSFV